MKFKSLALYKYYYLIFLLSLLPLFTVFTTSEFPHTHDGFVHLARMGAYYKALLDGQFPVRWAGDLNYGYGMPLFNFMYQLPYLLSSVFLSVGFGLVSSFKIVLSISFLVSGIFMFLFGKTFFNDEKKGFLSAVFYQFASFRLVELLTRGSFGEVYTYAFLPLVLFAMFSFLKKNNFFYFVLTGIASSLLILSHNSVSLIFFGICILFLLFFSKNIRFFLKGFLALISGLALSAFYWMPAIFEHKYTYGNLFMKDLYKEHFPPLLNFITPNFLNSKDLWIGGISIQIGVFHTLAILLSIILLFFSKKMDALNRKIILFGLLLIIVSLFFMQPLSMVFWENISFLRQFQFPWRFLSVISFATALLSANFLNFKILRKKFVFIIFILLITGSTFFYWKPINGFDKVNENYYWNYPLDTTYFGETNLIWSEGQASSYPKKRIDVIGGEAVVKNIYNKSNYHSFTVEAKTKAQIVGHIQYFPGWKVFVNKILAPIQFQDQNWRGQITFYVPKGLNFVEIEFTENRLRLLSDLVSMLSLFTLLFLSAVKIRKTL